MHARTHAHTHTLSLCSPVQYVEIHLHSMKPHTTASEWENTRTTLTVTMEVMEQAGMLPNMACAHLLLSCCIPYVKENIVVVDFHAS